MASISSIGIYCVVVVFIARQGGDGLRVPDAVRWALMATGYGMLAGAFVVRRALLSAPRIRALVEPPVDLEDLARNPNTGQIRDERLALLQQLSEEEAGLCRLARACFTPYLLTLALVDACAIMGLVLAILQRDARQVLAFAIPAGAVSLFHFPNLEGLLERTRLGLAQGFVV